MKYLHLLFLLITISIFPQKIRYEVSFPNLVHHEAEIKVTFSELKTDTLKLSMSRTSPGRYALHEFAKNIYNVKAEDENGNPLSLINENLHEWILTGHTGTLIFSYTLFGDRADGTYSQINSEHVHLNIPASVVFAEALKNIPIEINFDLPDEKNWKIATQLIPTDNPNNFSAPDLYYFLDSPVEIADLNIREWNVQSNGSDYKIRLAVHHTEDEKIVDAYQKLVEAIVLEAKEIFGEFPDFDFNTYTFLCDYVPYGVGDGMEHRNSTWCTSTRKISTAANALINTVAHEFFHCWNVERLRPQSLEPFDFTDANVSSELWFAEGFTEYYENIITARAGIHSIDSFAELISKYVNEVINTNGKNFYTPVEMSAQAPFVDAAASIDPQNKENTFISYYTWGAVIGLSLDLSLRKNFHGLSLDDYMKLLWEKFGKSETPYTNNDLKISLFELTGDNSFTDSFFEKYIYGKEIPDLNELLSSAGFSLKLKNENQTSAGKASFKEKDGKLFLSKYTLIGTPLYKSGLDKDDQIIKIDSFTINTTEDYYSALEKFEPGDKAIIEFEQNGIVKTSDLIFEKDNTVEILPYEHSSLPVNSDMESFRTSWLGSKSKNLPELLKYCPKCKRSFKYEYKNCSFDGSELSITN